MKLTNIIKKIHKKFKNLYKMIIICTLLNIIEINNFWISQLFKVLIILFLILQNQIFFLLVNQSFDK